MSHISYSELKDWVHCAFYHKLTRIDKLKGFKGNAFTAFGTAVHAVCEKKLLKEEIDDEGFIWVGSANGLFRFDGYEYKRIPFDAGIYVRAILSTKDKVWVGTIANGVHVVDKSTLQSINYKHQGSAQNSIAANKVNDLAIDKNDDIWLATAGGLSKFNQENGLFEQWRSLDDPKGYLANNIIDFTFSNFF